MRVVDWTLNKGYCEGITGCYNRNHGRGRYSRLVYGQNLKDKFYSFRHTSPPIKTTTHLIRVKSAGDKNLLPDSDTVNSVFNSRIQGTPSCLQKIKRINDVKREHSFTYLGKLFPVVDIYRVYNNEMLGVGGRFYGDFLQRLPSALRSEIKISGQSVVELDYSALHPQMLYDIRDIPVDSDPYAIEGYARAVVKQAFQRVLNNTSKPLAIKSVRHFLRQEPPMTIVDPEKLVNAILYKHRAVLKFEDSETCMGLQLQNVDSEIALEVMYHFARKEIPCIGIHDSFIVPERYQAELQTIMAEKYNEAVRLEFVRNYERTHNAVCHEHIWRSKRFKPRIK